MEELSKMKDAQCWISETLELVFWIASGTTRMMAEIQMVLVRTLSLSETWSGSLEARSTLRRRNMQWSSLVTAFEPLEPLSFLWVLGVLQIVLVVLECSCQSSRQWLGANLAVSFPNSSTFMRSCRPNWMRKISLTQVFDHSYSKPPTFFFLLTQLFEGFSVKGLNFFRHSGWVKNAWLCVLIYTYLIYHI